MTERTNAYFTGKKALLEAYCEKRAALNREKDAAWGRNDAEAARRCIEERDAMTCPLTEGEAMAVRFWNRSADTLVADDHLWTKDVHDFVSALRDAGVETFLFTDQSTALMETIHEFAKEDLTLTGPETFTDNETWNGEPRTRLALRFTF